MAPPKVTTEVTWSRMPLRRLMVSPTAKPWPPLLAPTARAAKVAKAAAPEPPPPPEKEMVGIRSPAAKEPGLVRVRDWMPEPEKGLNATGGPWEKSGVMLESMKVVPVTLPMKPKLLPPGTAAP